MVRVNGIYKKRVRPISYMSRKIETFGKKKKKKMWLKQRIAILAAF